MNILYIVIKYINNLIKLLYLKFNIIFIDFDDISSYDNMNIKFYYKYKNAINWKLISKNKILSEDFIREFKDNVDWLYISSNQILSENFIREFQNKVDWLYISTYQELSENFIRKFNDMVNWNMISNNQILSEDFIREFKDDVDWDFISSSQKLSEDFIREFKDDVDWDFISAFQKLSEDFIREFQNYVNWYRISIYQELSENFIRKFNYIVNWNMISNNQILSENFISEFKDKIYINNYNWLYETTEFKKQAIIDSGLYECYDDYFIAYKAIRKDRYSKFNFQYQYLPNNYYISRCDHTNNENSFGLSVWTEKEAKEYGGNNSLIVKVKVNYEDVGRLVNKSCKIRCSKIYIID